jgi:hypothetical protein
VYNALFGVIQDIKITDTEYGKQLTVALDPDDDGMTPIIALNVTSRYGIDLLKRLPNVDLAKEVRFMPFVFDNDEGKEVMGLRLDHKDGEGNVIKDEFFGKNYLQKITKFGQIIYDPRFLQDDLKRNGISEPLDYTLIPSFNWKTNNNEELIIDGGSEILRKKYLFSGDTLITVSERGFLEYLLKINKE